MAHKAVFGVVLANLLLQLQIVLTEVPAVIVFGDSSVDTGNNNQIATVVKSNFEPYGRDFYGGRPTGRFSNGRVFTDFISEAFGIKLTMPAYLDPAHNMTDMATGVCFASAGTGYDNATSDVLVSQSNVYREIKHLGNESSCLITFPLKLDLRLSPLFYTG